MEELGLCLELSFCCRFVHSSFFPPSPPSSRKKRKEEGERWRVTLPPFSVRLDEKKQKSCL